MTWFEEIFGFRETKENINNYITIKENKMFSSANNRSFLYGDLETPTLKNLRNRLPEENGSIQVSEIIGDIKELHKNEEHALFQVASQFNLLEMMSPAITKEQGITRYLSDMTQGPACAIACAAGTLYRNYYTNVNTLDNIENMFDEKYWTMKNGYALFEEKELFKFNNIIDRFEETIKENLKVGIQWNTEVVKTGKTVSQIYCSALPVSYNYNIEKDDFEKFARLILEATYEATFIASILNNKSNKVYLTLVGAGAFGNEREWVIGSIKKNIKKFKNYDIDVVLVNYSEYYGNIHLKEFYTK